MHSAGLKRRLLAINWIVAILVRRCQEVSVDVRLRSARKTEEKRDGSREIQV